MAVLSDNSLQTSNQNRLGALGKPSFRSPPTGATDKPILSSAHKADLFEAARPRDAHRTSLREVAALSLSVFGALSGASTSSASTASVSTVQVELQVVSSEEARSVTLDQLKEEVREAFGRAPRTRAETFRRLDSLEQKGVLSLEYSPTGRTILSELSELTRQPLAEGVHRRNLIRDVVRHLDNPELMKQGRRDTCAAAGLQHLLSGDDPSQYIHIVRGLVAPIGSVVTRQGEVLQRVEHSIDDNSGRSEVSSVIQSAIMDYANGPEVYSNREDLSAGNHTDHLHEANPHIPESGHIEGGHPGLYPNEITRALSALFGPTAETVYVAPVERMGKRSEFESILGNEGLIVAGIQWGEGTHLLVIKEISDEGVTAWNPWGESGNRDRARSSFDDPFFGRGMSPMMLSAQTSRSSPDYEVISETGLIRFTSSEFFTRLQSYEFVTRVGL